MFAASLLSLGQIVSWIPKVQVISARDLTDNHKQKALQHAKKGKAENNKRLSLAHPSPSICGCLKIKGLRFHFRTRVDKLHHLQAFQQILRDLISLSLFHHVPSPCLADHGPPSTIHCCYLCSPAIQQTPLFAQSPAPVGLAHKLAQDLVHQPYLIIYVSFWTCYRNSE